MGDPNLSLTLGASETWTNSSSNSLTIAGSVSNNSNALTLSANSGGGISVTELGPKDARVDMVGNALCDVDYFRTGMRGVYQAAVQLFCASAYSVELGRGRAPRSTAMRISWA